MHMEHTSLMSMGHWTFRVHKGWRNHTIEQGGCISRTHDMEGELVQKEYAQTIYMKCLIVLPHDFWKGFCQETSPIVEDSKGG